MDKMDRKKEPLRTIVNTDEFTSAIEKAFDCVSNGMIEYYPWAKPNIPESFGIGVIVGSSGSGKSTLLRDFGVETSPKWKYNEPIISHFENPDDAINRLSAVGLNSVPSWYLPYHVLSNGEQFRADLARKLSTGAVIDEFTSVVDRNVAKAASVALSRYVKKTNIKNLVLSTCHRDVLDWLEPDWVIDTDLGEYTEGFFLSDQKLRLKSFVQNAISGQCLRNIII